ncbi:hypothetical protein [Hominifimenecus sp. rT4P-3]|uniref:hypothetical protein n=1 Tax=Hominifimenecus sp. rT4P-3 TaxID=3242979 RepID=UPI003DA448F2
MYQEKRLSNGSPRRRSRRKTRKSGMLLISLLLLVLLTIGGTAAYLLAHTEPVVNQFTPSHVSCTVTEDFNGTRKSNVNVTNTGDTEAYIRVKLVTYRVNDELQHIGGMAEIPDFTLGTGWVKYGDYYYYTLPVEAGQSPEYPLIDTSGITLTGVYDDADGGKQVMEVIAEAIQSSPARAAGTAWGVSISEGSISAYGH